MPMAEIDRSLLKAQLTAEQDDFVAARPRSKAAAAAASGWSGACP